LFYFTGGYVQVRMQLPDMTTGAWPALWHLEAGREIDTQDSGFLYGTTSPNRVMTSALQSPQTEQQFDKGVDLSAGYHIYGMEYRPGVSVKTYLDGGLKATFTDSIPTSGATILINLEMCQTASSWHPVVSSATPATVQMSVSELQVYHL
jgi:beta-glucanase (GH16 family)